MKSNYNKIAKDILVNNQYLALATLGKDNNPWVNGAAYVYDEKFNLYFLSYLKSKHIVNLMKNSKTAFIVYDSRQDWGMGVGLQGEGIVEKVKLTEFPKVVKLYFSRKYPYGTVTNAFAKGIKGLLKKKTYTFFKITSSTLWINNPDADVDERVEVKL